MRMVLCLCALAFASFGIAQDAIALAVNAPAQSTAAPGWPLVITAVPPNPSATAALRSATVKVFDATGKTIPLALSKVGEGDSLAAWVASAEATRGLKSGSHHVVLTLAAGKTVVKRFSVVKDAGTAKAAKLENADPDQKRSYATTWRVPSP